MRNIWIGVKVAAPILIIVNLVAVALALADTDQNTMTDAEKVKCILHLNPDRTLPPQERMVKWRQAQDDCIKKMRAPLANPSH